MSLPPTQRSLGELIAETEDAHAALPLAGLEIADDREHRGVHALDHRGQDVFLPGCGVDAPGQPRNGEILVGIDADGPQLVARCRQVNGCLEDTEA